MISFIGRTANKSETCDIMLQSDISPGDEGCVDMTVSCISGSSVE